MSGYIGTQPVPQATQTRQTFTATASQTSFATGGYQAGYLDVFLNGVKMVDGTDYTATNGSDVVLTTGAASGDTLEVVAYTAFTVADQAFTGDISIENLDVTGSFTSRGIDDNATSTAMTLDSSGNLLVGKTTPALATAGTALRGDNAGLINSARAGTILELNRLSTDGSIVDFFKDGSAVGRIGSTAGTHLYAGSGDAGLLFQGGADAIEPWNPSTNAARDNALDLGLTSNRFKDLYLSGGVYLGGTGSANKLDDYEEGTFTPTFENGTFTYNVQNGTYTKVGNLVTIACNVGWTSRSGSGAVNIIGLPFIPINSGNTYRGGGSLGTITGVNKPTNYQMTVGVDANLSKFFLRYFVDNGSWVGTNVGDLNASGEIQVTASYHAQ